MPQATSHRIAVLLVLVGSASCAGTGGSDPEPWPPRGATPTRVEVRNDNWSDVRVYALCGQLKQRLASVPSMTMTRLSLPEAVTGCMDDIHFLVDPIGGGQEHVTAGLVVSGGETVSLRVRNQIGLTVVTVR